MANTRQKKTKQPPEVALMAVVIAALDAAGLRANGDAAVHALRARYHLVECGHSLRASLAVDRKPLALQLGKELVEALLAMGDVPAPQEATA